MLISVLIPGTVHAAEEDEIPLWLYETLDLDPDDPYSLPVYALYEPDYRTLRYTGWETYENGTESITIATDRVVVRRGTTLVLGGYTEASAELLPTKDGMTTLEVEENKDGWHIDIPTDSTVGNYIFNVSKGDWSKEIDIFVVFDPWTLNISEDKLRAYAYDESSNRPEVDYILTSGFGIHGGTLRPFGDDREGWLDMYEFALAAVGNTTDPQEAAARIIRVVAQRNVAVPSGFDKQPLERDASQILFGSGETTIHHVTYDYEGLTIDDAITLSMNGATIPEIANYDQVEKSKLINGWCDEVSWAKTALLRSIGIPSRVASVHPTEDTELMGHFMSEAWFEDSLYRADWADDGGGWYVLDADEWNARWYVADPVFWMPAGECFSSRANYGLMAEVLYMGQYKIEGIYVPGTDEITNINDFIDVTDHYINDEVMYLDYGTLTKLKGRGAGDYYKVSVRTNSRLSIESSPSVNASLYVSNKDFPAIPVATEGYPFRTPVSSYYGDEVVLDSGTYYIGIYAPKNGNPSVEGDFGTYTLHLEETPHLEPTFMDVREIPEDLDLRTYLGHLVAFILLIVWVVSYYVMKETR